MRRRRAERGVEAIELVAGLPLVGIVVLLAWQGISLARQQVEAETDARVMARQAAVCSSDPHRLRPIDVDPAMTADDLVVAPDGAVRVSVSLRPRAVLDLPGFAAALDRGPWPRATVTMRREPC